MDTTSITHYFSVCTFSIVCPGAFSCDNANCIASSEECDHTDDCGDNSDEDHCDGRINLF